MKKPRPLFTNFSKNNQQKLVEKMKSLVDKSLPKNVMGMLATAKRLDDNKSILLYNRYLLISEGMHDYTIFDTKLKVVLYNRITLFSSAINIIFNLNRNYAKEKQIYSLDQEYMRCVVNIQNYKYHIKRSSAERAIHFANRLSCDEHRLAYLKDQLNKVF